MFYDTNENWMIYMRAVYIRGLENCISFTWCQTIRRWLIDSFATQYSVFPNYLTKDMLVYQPYCYDLYVCYPSETSWFIVSHHNNNSISSDQHFHFFLFSICKYNRDGDDEMCCVALFSLRIVCFSVNAHKVAAIFKINTERRRKQIETERESRRMKIKTENLRMVH